MEEERWSQRKETANLPGPRGEDAGRMNPPASLCSQAPFSYRSLPMAEPNQEPERPGCPSISDAAHRAARTRLDREAGGATRKHPVRKLPGEEGIRLGPEVENLYAGK